MGLFLVAAATLHPEAVGGAAVYVVGHAGAKSALFLIVGILLDRHQTVDELELSGRGRGQRLLAACYLTAGLALAGLPPFGTALGKALCEDALGSMWGIALFVTISAATGGAVLRAGARCFTKWGGGSNAGQPANAAPRGDEEPDTVLRRIPPSMYVPIVVLLVGCLAVGVLPHVAEGAELAGRRFVDTAGYIAAVFGRAVPSQSMGPAPSWSAAGIGIAVAGVLAAVCLAVVALHQQDSSSPLRRIGVAVARPALAALRGAHSGHVGDYVAWMFAGLTVLAAVLGLQLR
jgi:multicomponent Na+:H+ antiporter subunit D